MAAGRHVRGLRGRWAMTAAHVTARVLVSGVNGAEPQRSGTAEGAHTLQHGEASSI